MEDTRKEIPLREADSVRDDSRQRAFRWIGKGALSLAVVFIWLTGIDRPEPPTGDLDPSWQAALGRAHEADLQFGRDILFTHGPWSWLASHFLMEEALTGKRLWETCGKLLLSIGTVALSLRLPVARRAVFLFLLPACGLFFPDTTTVAMLSLAFLFGLMDPRTPRWALVPIAAAMGFLCATKFIFLMIVFPGVALAACGRVWKRQWHEALLMSVSLLFSFLLAWVSAGQSLLLIADHLRMSAEISSGYGGAMSLDEPGWVFVLGAATVVIFFASAFATMRRNRDRATFWPIALFVCWVTFLTWKHGFTRADGHVLALFNQGILLGVCAGPALGNHRWRDPFLLAAATAFTGVLIFNAGFVQIAPGELVRRMQWGAGYVVAPEAMRAQFVELLASRKTGAALPKVSATVGTGSIDLLNYQQAALMLNDLNYVGRPVLQSYSAYTPTLMRRNLRFFQRERAPAYVLWMHGTIDGRFPSQDDSLVLAELPRRYEPVLASVDSLLLRRRPIQPATRDAQRELVVERTLGWEESFEIPGDYQSSLWLQASFNQSRTGKLRSALYKAGTVTMTVRDFQDRESTHRIIPGIAAEGFLIHPFLNSQQDVNQFAEGKASSAIRSVRFTPGRPDERELWANIDIRIFRLPELPIDQISPWAGYVSQGITTHAPLTVTSGIAVEMFMEAAVPSVLLHSPGEMTFQVDPTMRCVAGIFGMRSGAYTGDGASDGVEFVIEARLSGGARIDVWNRFLDPLNQPRDRGDQTFDVCAPEDATHLYFITRPGPSGNTNWDWAYFGNLRFAPDPIHR